MNNLQTGTSFPINPLASIAASPATLARIARLLVMVSALVTGYGFYLIVFQKCADYNFPDWVGHVFGVALAAVSIIVTDYGLLQVIDYVLFYFFGLPIRGRSMKMHEGVNIKYWRYWASDVYRHYILHPLLWAVMAAIAFGMFYADRLAAGLASATIANAAPQKETVDVEFEQGKLLEKNRQMLAPLQFQITDAEKRIRAADQKIVAQNSALASLASGGNGWAKNKIAALKNAAKKEDEILLNRLRKNHAEGVLGATIATQTTVSLLASKNQSTMERNKKFTDFTETSVYTAGWFTKLIGLACRVVLIMMMFARGEGLDVNGDGKIDLSDLNAYAGQPQRGWGSGFFG